MRESKTDAGRFVGEKGGSRVPKVQPVSPDRAFNRSVFSHCLLNKVCDSWHADCALLGQDNNLRGGIFL